LGDLLQPGGHAAADRLDHRCHGAFCSATVVIGIGGDDLLVDRAGHLHRDVLVGIEHAGQPVVLAG
jgi:hypothetical protein